MNNRDLDLGATVEAAMGRGASQDRWELRAVLGLVAGLAPAVMIEVGCDQGGTLFAWRSVCGRVYGITHPDNGPERCGSGLPLETYGAVVHVGDSHDEASLLWLAKAITGGKPIVPDPVDVLVLDGDHLVAGVLADLAMYGPLVRPGGVILLHDIHWREEPDKVQVHEVWPGLAERYATTEIHNTGGGGPAQGWGVIWVQPGDQFTAAA